METFTRGRIHKDPRAEMVEAFFKKKKKYYEAKWKNGTSGHNRMACPFGGALEELLGPRPLSQVDNHGVDVGFESTTGGSQTFISFINVQQRRSVV